ncbi:MAG: nitrilase-related carbon-nitrogen hydrolase [Acidimicrobiales bacterium]|nr:nitrilase-related carbon-nitrogen hydrolase [Acidimicrobiales bacterium]
MTVLRVGLLQHDIVWEDREATLEHLAPMVASAAAKGAGLVLATELFAVGFSMATDAIAEPEGGPTSRWLSEQAARHGVWIGGSIPEVAPSADRPANCFVLAAPDGTQHRYAKVHGFTYGGEHEHFAPGSGELTVDVEGVRVTPFVCYDLRFADRWWQRAKGTDLYVCVASWPQQRRAHWQTLLRARAIENLAYVAGANRVGAGGGIDYAGDSCVMTPFGDVVADGERAGEAVLVADVDTDVVAATRARYPFLDDR